MTEPGNGNGNGHTTIVQSGFKLGGQVITHLLPQFLALVIVNALFLCAFVWFVDRRAQHSVEVIQQLLRSCLNKGVWDAAAADPEH